MLCWDNQTTGNMDPCVEKNSAKNVFEQKKEKT